jgi:hypothetical protein
MANLREDHSTSRSLEVQRRLEQARDCEQKAAAAINSDAKATLRQIAKLWHDLASQLDRLERLRSPLLQSSEIFAEARSLSRPAAKEVSGDPSAPIAASIDQSRGGVTGGSW